MTQVHFQADPFDSIKRRAFDPSKHYIVFALESATFVKGSDNARMLDVVLQDYSEPDAAAIYAQLEGQFVANGGGCTIGTARFLAVYSKVPTNPIPTYPTVRVVPSMRTHRTWRGLQSSYAVPPSPAV